MARHLPLLCLAAAALAGCRSEPPRTSVLLVTVDTLRADHLGCFGYPRPTSPHIDAMASEGVLFTGARTSCPLTVSAHASLFTGLYPVAHKVLLNGHTMDPSIPLLAEGFGREGYATAAITSVSFLQVLARGFATFDAGGDGLPPGSPGAIPAGGPPPPYRVARLTVDAACAFLDTLEARRPFFLWVHLFDPHQPNIAPGEVAAELALGTPEARAAARELWIDDRGLAPTSFPSEEALVDYVNGYDAEIRYADRELARLDERLGALGRRDATLVVVLSDHGEGLGQHSYLGHTDQLHEEQLRIPLVMRLPGQLPAGRRVEAPCSIVDLPATIAAVARVPFGGPGRSLLPALEGAAGAGQTPVLAERRPRGSRRYPDERLTALVTRRYKYVHHSDTPHELFDLVADPGETRPLDLESTQARALARSLDEAYDEARAGGEAYARGARDASHDQELEALGYVQ